MLLWCWLAKICVTGYCHCGNMVISVTWKWTWAGGMLLNDSNVRFNTVLYKLTAATHGDKRKTEIRSRWIFQCVAADSTVQRVSGSLRWLAVSSFVVPVEKFWWWVICMLQGKQGTYLMLLCCCLVDSNTRSGWNTFNTFRKIYL